MPKLPEGFKQFNFRVEEGLLEAFRTAAESKQSSVTAEIIGYMEAVVSASKEEENATPHRKLKTGANLGEEFLREQRLRRLEHGLRQTLAAINTLEARVEQIVSSQAFSSDEDKRHLSESQPAGPDEA